MENISIIFNSWKLIAFTAILFNILLGVLLIYIYKIRYKNGIVDGAAELCENAGRQLPVQQKETLLNYCSTIVYKQCNFGFAEQILDGVRARMYSPKCNSTLGQEFDGDGELCNDYLIED